MKNISSFSPSPTRRKYNILTVSLSFFLLYGCTTLPNINSLGGSKADGVVKFGYSEGLFTAYPTPEQLEEVKISALESCKLWGYQNAKPFGGFSSKCTARGAYGNCFESDKKFIYQCYNK